MEFIYECENFLPPDICKQLINKFETSEEQQKIGQVGEGRVNINMKKSVDLTLSGTECDIIRKFSITGTLIMTQAIIIEYVL